MKIVDKILSPLGERFQSPLYSTFLLSWCVSNWKIFYVTFIISPEDLHYSKLEYMKLYISDPYHMLVYPLGFTFAYLFIFPYIEKEVSRRWYRSRASRKEAIVNEVEKSPVSSEEHKALLTKYLNRETELTGYFNREIKMLKEKEEESAKHTEVLEKYAEAERRNSSMSETISLYQKRTKMNEVFQDIWSLTFKDSTTGAIMVEYFKITPSNEYFIELENKAKFAIRHFYLDYVTNETFFLKVDTSNDQNPSMFFNDLIRKDDFTFDGQEYGIKRNETTGQTIFQTRQVVYRKSRSEGISTSNNENVKSMKKNANQSLTMHYMYGEWEYKDSDKHIRLSFKELPGKLLITFNGRESEIPRSGAWMGNDHYEMGGYFIRFANETEMAFGQNTSLVVGNNDWEEIFTRI